MLNASEHHPVADMGRSDIGEFLEFLDDRFRTPKEQTVPESLVIQFSFVRDGINLSVDHIVPIQASLGAVLPAGVL